MNTRSWTKLSPALAVALGGAGLLVGCATTDPGAGADITYHLPQTTVTADLTLTLKRCWANDVAVEVAPALQATSGVGEAVHIKAGTLASSRIQRDVLIQTGDDLVITGVNAQATDMTGQIIQNGLKTILSLAGAAAPAGLVDDRATKTKAGPCTPEIQAALLRVDALKARIAGLRVKLGSIGPEDVKDAKELKALLKELGAYEAGPLQLTLSEDLPLAGAPGFEGPWAGKLEFKPRAFEKWFGEGAASQLGAFPVAWSASRAGGTATPAKIATCKVSINVPNASPVAFAIQGGGSLNAAKSSGTFPIAQINAPAQLCLDVGFGERRGIELAFDKFGRTTKLHWTSDATAANVSGTIAGVAPDVKALLTKDPKPSPVDLQKAEIERLKTLQEYNAMKACEAVLAAGGSDCDVAGQ